MKILFLTFFAVFLILRPSAQIKECNIRTIQQVLPPVTWAQQSIDGQNQPVWLTRFLHNKVGIAGSQFAKCYFNSTDPVIAFKSLGLLGFISWIFFIYFIFSKKFWPLIFIFLLEPVIPLMSEKEQIITFFYKIYAIMGAIFYLKNI